MQTVLDAYLVGYNTGRPHQGRGMNDRTPAKVFRDGITTNSRKAVQRNTPAIAAKVQQGENVLDGVRF
jgi:hypothetical protein